MLSAGRREGFAPCLTALQSRPDLVARPCHSSPWRKARKLGVHALKNNTNRPPIACQVPQSFFSAFVARPFERCVAIVRVCQSLKIGVAGCMEAARPFGLPYRAPSLAEQQRNVVSDS